MRKCFILKDKREGLGEEGTGKRRRTALCVSCQPVAVRAWCVPSALLLQGQQPAQRSRDGVHADGKTKAIVHYFTLYYVGKDDWLLIFFLPHLISDRTSEE